jgi:hypothetical protein
MSLTGPLAGNGKAALISMQIWREDVNARGGILGRKVEFVYYDDQTNPSTVPSIYSKLLDVDKVDLVVSGYGTNVIAPAMPIMMQRNMTFMGLFGLNVNSKFNYDRYFQIMPSGPDPAIGWTQGFFDTAMSLNPKPTDRRAGGSGREYPALALQGAREQVKRTGSSRLRQELSAQHRRLLPIIRAIQATNPDLVYVASYPPDSAGMIRAANEVGLKTRMFGGGMVGPQFAALKTQLGPLLNGLVNYEKLRARGRRQVSFHRPVPRQVPGARREGRRRRPRLLPAPLRLRDDGGARAVDQGGGSPRPGEARRPHAQDGIQYLRRQSALRQERRMGAAAHARGAIPRHHGQRPRPVAQAGACDGAYAGAIQDRQRDDAVPGQPQVVDFPTALILNAIVAGLLLGGFYAAVSVGVSISFGMLDVVNIAHPAFIILGSYMAYIVNDRLGVDPIAVSLVCRRSSSRSGWLIYRIYYVCFEKRGQEPLRGLAFFFGILFITEVALILVFGVDYRMARTGYSETTWRLGPWISRCGSRSRSSCRSRWSSACSFSSRIPSSAARCSRWRRTRSRCGSWASIRCA